MRTLTSKFFPNATDMIRMDHTHVIAAFHQYDANASARTKKAVANTVCLSLEIHAQLEEEIFYPAMRGVGHTAIDQRIPEHEQMRQLISRLRGMEPTDADYDQSFMELMRNVMHHVAEEETGMLPEAERLLGEQLRDLGAQMTRRRLQLSAPRMGEMAVNTARSMPVGAIALAAGALLAGTYVARQAVKRSRTGLG
jgi:hypothetical protein